MEVKEQSNSKAISDCKQNDISELNESGLKVWCETQEVLEQQALQELNGLIEEPSKVADSVSKSEKDKKKIFKPKYYRKDTSGYTFDLVQLIEHQKQLKKIQDHKKSLQVSDKSRCIANQINQRQLQQNVTSKAQRQPKNRDCPSSTITKASESRVIDEDARSLSGSEYYPSDCDSDADYSENFGRNRTKPTRIEKNAHNVDKVVDDGNLKCYKERLNAYYEDLENKNKRAMQKGDELPETEVLIENNLKTCSSIWRALYAYQQDGVKWLYSIFQQTKGGLLGDEMGLGKTVQVIAFLHALNYSRVISKFGGFEGLGATLIVCPSTVLHQWVKHFHDWAPEFRVSILHQSGSYVGNRIKLIKENMKNKGILVTTYQSMLKYRTALIAQHWHYVILDEGHKIRNPSAQISEAVKLFQTPYRLLLTGSPMQNNLQELWSLFDFVQPSMLGTLPVFIDHFAAPIMQGGYTNATPMQEHLALSMATALKNLITPHLLRRAKSDVKMDIELPNKNEQVLFCSITPEQRDLYKGFLLSDSMSSLLRRDDKHWYTENAKRANVLMSITILRKICNHPDIYINDGQENEEDQGNKFGHFNRSGKMIVVEALLKMWRKQGHRILLFTQSRAMIGIFERFLKENDYNYLKMDGSTNVAARQPLINRFNEDTSFHVFLLTTRVGGLGVNLIGANRVIIYDPDWNPATDVQARERAWRIGQKKDVTICRLLSAGTIEEKMYQRQVWKQLLSNKVLLDPKTQKFFRSSDLSDLFSLQDNTDTVPETTNIFHSSRIKFEEKMKKKNKKEVHDSDGIFSKAKIEQMKQQAAIIAKSLSNAAKVDSKQEELNEARKRKLSDREMLKKLSPNDLLHHNREKLARKEENAGNALDDCETKVNFTKALIISEKAGDLYNATKSKPKLAEDAVEKYKLLTQIFDDGESTNKRKRCDDECDVSGQIDGQCIEGLLRVEQNARKKLHTANDASQDNYVLRKLFRRKGLRSALQHDSIAEFNVANASIKMYYETKERLENAMSALKNSRSVH